MSIRDYSIEELEQELERKKDPSKGKPQCCAEPDFTKVIELAKEIVQSVAENGHPISEYNYWMFDAVVNACYGEDFWDWWNENKW